MDYLPFVIILANFIISYIGMTDYNFKNKYLFNISALKQGQWYRVLSSSFLHADYQHLIFNMLTLYFFSHSGYMVLIGNIGYLIVYFGSIISGNLLSYLRHRNENYYSALGASGGVTGIVFSFICFYPMTLIYGIIPAVIYAIGYIIYTYWAMKKSNDNIGHDAHLGGVIFGLSYTFIRHFDQINIPFI